MWTDEQKVSELWDIWKRRGGTYALFETIFAKALAAERTATGGEEPKPQRYRYVGNIRPAGEGECEGPLPDGTAFVTFEDGSAELVSWKDLVPIAPALPAPDKAQEEVAHKLEEALDRIEELEREAETVSAEFEKECWTALRSLLNEFSPNWADGDGMTADNAAQALREEFRDLERELSTAHASGREEGEREMREAAAKAADDVAARMLDLREAAMGNLRDIYSHEAYGAEVAAGVIRALPVPSPAKERGE